MDLYLIAYGNDEAMENVSTVNRCGMLAQLERALADAELTEEDVLTILKDFKRLHTYLGVDSASDVLENLVHINRKRLEAALFTYPSRPDLVDMYEAQEKAMKKLYDMYRKGVKK